MEGKLRTAFFTIPMSIQGDTIGYPTSDKVFIKAENGTIGFEGELGIGNSLLPIYKNNAQYKRKIKD